LQEEEKDRTEVSFQNTEYQKEIEIGPRLLNDDPSTIASEEFSFEPIPMNKRHRWTVHTTQEKRMGLEPTSKFSKYWENPMTTGAGILGVKSLRELCGPKLSSLVDSFSSSKGLPYLTELAFEDRDEGTPDVEEEEEVVDNMAEHDDKYNVLKQIETPKEPGLL